MLTKGLCIFGDKKEYNEKRISDVKKKFNVDVGEIFDFDINMVYNPQKDIDLDLIRYCFEWSKKWEVIAPLGQYTELISSIAKDNQIDYLKSIMWDLRVPAYDTRIIFVRNTDSMKEFWKIYTHEIKILGESRLAFSVALWKIKPLILTLSNRFIKG